MLHAVFAHDHVFVRDRNEVRYTSGKLPYRMWARYLESFSRLTVVARERSAGAADDLAQLDVASGEGVRFAPLPNVSSLRGLLMRRSVLRRAIEIVQDADVVIARVPSEIGAVVAEAARRVGKLVALEIVACPWDALWNHGSLSGKAYAPWATRALRAAARDAEFALYVSADFLQKRYPSTGRAVACSDVEIGTVDESVLTARLAKVGAVSAQIRLGLIGSLNTNYKGVDTALKALARLADSHGNVVLDVLGGGDVAPWRKLAARLGVAERVRFLGTMPAGGPVLAWLRDVDLYLQPSRTEGLPRALIEAMSQGCPCIGSTAGGIPELLEAECLHRPGDVSGLTARLQQALSSPSWMRRHAERNFREAQRYSGDRLDAVRRRFWADVAEAAQARRCA